MLCLNVCENRQPETPSITESPGLVVIRGATNTLTNTMTLQPGTTVQFASIITAYHSGGLGCGYENDRQQGRLTISDGGKLIAQGTADNPVIFEISNGDTGLLIFEETADSSSTLEYCEFKGNINIQISNNMAVQYCKFENETRADPDIQLGSLGIRNDSKMLLKYNTFNKSGIEIRGTSSPNITFNDIDGKNSSLQPYGIWFDSQTNPIIESNNIVNTQYSAVLYNTQFTSYTITSNYIANCDGKTGADSTGIQCWNIIYNNPQTANISNSGCGW